MTTGAAVGDYPDCIAQTAEPMTEEGRRAWISARAEEGRKLGVQLSRATLSKDGSMLLFEGWLDRGAKQGEPEWQLVAS